MSEAPSFIPAAQPKASDKLDALKANARTARDWELEIGELEEELKTLKKNLNIHYQETLPKLMDDVGVDHIGIAQDGNLPAMDFKLKPFYSANIAYSWPQDRREAAFDYLKSVDAGDLIKTLVTASMPKGNLELAEKLVKVAREMDIPATLSLSVHGGTLTAWLRELVETHHTYPSQEDLAKIGGSIGRVVKPQERKE